MLGLLLAWPVPDPPRPAAEDPARLVVLVVVDQMIPEQLDRLEPWLVGGLGRFVDRGEVWKRAEHRYGATETGPGHATLGTGVYPARHGIVANQWLATDQRRFVYCVEDPDAWIVTSDGPVERDLGRRSPASLLAPSLADHVKAADPAAICVGIAGKDRASILATGAQADVVLWWDPLGRGFVSSTWYGRELPAWVRDWNSGWIERATADGRLVWSSTLEGDLAPAGTAEDDREGESAGFGTRTLPHAGPASGADGTSAARAGTWVYTSYLSDELVVELGRRAVEELDLGGDAHPDYLFLGLSACDAAGHGFGPYSVEVTDVLLRADRLLGKLFALLDERIGEDAWVAALASDHGVLELPEALIERGVPARRLDPASIGGDVRAVAARLDGGFLGMNSTNGIRLDGAALAEAGMDASDVRAAWAEELAGLDWVARVLTLDELLAPDPGDPLAVLLARSTFEGRSPDVAIVRKPWHVELGAGTDHGTPWPYDRAIPLAFLGPGSPHDERWEAVDSVCLVPTLLSRAGLPVPAGLDGTVLR